MKKIGPIRNTHYGGFYDFTPNMEHADTAYTNLALDPHTDTTYFTEPAGLQAFHLLSHEPPPGEPADTKLGGLTILVDGFHAALALQKENAPDYETLKKVDIPWHASGNEGVAIMPNKGFPVLEHFDNGQLFRVRWNNDDRGIIGLNGQTGNWYRAARKWQKILNRKSLQLKFQLEPGDLLSQYSASVP